MLTNSKNELSKTTVYLSDIEMEKVMYVCFMLLKLYIILYFFSLPSLNKCEIFMKKLVDPLLKDAYAELPKLPRYEL
jgi:hypothetical protein